MKKTLCILLGLAFAVCLRAADEPDRFRNLKWGSGPSDVGEMELLKEETTPSGEVKNYRKKGEILVFGTAQLESIEYSFWQDRLWAIRLEVRGEEAYDALKATCTQRFGEAPHASRVVERSIWKGRRTLMVLDFDEVRGNGRLILMSVVIKEQMDAAKEEKKESEPEAEAGVQGGEQPEPGGGAGAP